MGRLTGTHPGISGGDDIVLVLSSQDLQSSLWVRRQSGHRRRAVLLDLPCHPFAWRWWAASFIAGSSLIENSLMSEVFSSPHMPLGP